MIDLDIYTTGKREYSDYFRMLVAGPSGSGKTRFAATFPNPIWANAKGGLMSIADKAIPYVDIYEQSDLLKLKIALEEGDAKSRERRFGRPVDTLVIDTIDEFQRILLAERLMNERRGETMASDYGWLGQTMHSIFEGLQDLPLHVVVICHLKDVVDGEGGKLYVKPGLQGAFADQIHQYMDFCLLSQAKRWVNKDTGEVFRESYLQSYHTSVVDWTKDYSGKLPDEFILDFTDDYKRMADIVWADLPSDSQKIKLEVAEETKEEEIDSRLAEPPTIREAAGKAKVLEKESVPHEPKLLDKPCSACGNQIASPWDELSKIRFQVELCKECFDKRRNAE